MPCKKALQTQQLEPAKGGTEDPNGLHISPLLCYLSIGIYEPTHALLPPLSYNTREARCD